MFSFNFPSEAGTNSFADFISIDGWFQVTIFVIYAENTFEVLRSRLKYQQATKIFSEFEIFVSINFFATKVSFNSVYENSSEGILEKFTEIKSWVRLDVFGISVTKKGIKKR